MWLVRTFYPSLGGILGFLPEDLPYSKVPIKDAA